MADKIINARLRLKYDTEANWTSKNPVLLAGEMAISSDKNGQFKAGNGTSTWSQLAYNQVPWTSVTGRPDSLKNPSALTMQFNGVTNKTYDGSAAQVVNITPAAIGAAPTSHTHNYMDLTRSTSRHSAGSLSVIDAAKIDVGRACRTAFLPASGIKVEYTTDGTTWIDYGLSDSAKQGLCSMNRATTAQLGKGADQKVGNGVRITLIPVDRYSSADQFYCWFNTNGATCTCSVEKSTIGEKTTFTPVLTDVPVAGWSGNNVLSLPGYTFGGGTTQNSNAYAYRMTFKITAVSPTYTTAPTVTDLRLYGVNAWTSANSMMLSDHIYSWDYAQNVKFPASLNAVGGLMENGTALSAKYQAKGSYAPSDHSHSAASAAAAGLMSSSDKKKLDKLGGLKTCTLTASGWSSTVPYTQTVSVSGITSADNPIISLDIPDGTTAANETAMRKAYGYLSNATTGSGTITFKCIKKKPVSNFNLSVMVFQQDKMGIEIAGIYRNFSHN